MSRRRAGAAWTANAGSSFATAGIAFFFQELACTSGAGSVSVLRALFVAP
jgi:hypothetical protein